MKLYCTAKLQKKLGRKCEKTPASENKLEDWYASIVTLEDATFFLQRPFLPFL